MKHKRCRFLLRAAIMVTMLTPVAGTPSLADDRMKGIQRSDDERGVSFFEARSFDRFAKRLKRFDPFKHSNPSQDYEPFKRSKPYKKFKKSDRFLSFPQPETRRSRFGRLHTKLEVMFADNLVQDYNTREYRKILTPTYEGKLIGPTLQVKPGDTIFITQPNKLPENPDDPAHPQRTGLGDNFPHDPYTTNLHTHGLTVSPKGISDNILREFVPGETKHTKIHIPPDHQSGTFWYHPHKHGAVSFQFFGGMTGFLIIDGGPGTLDYVPEVKAAKEVLMGFQVIRTNLEGNQPVHITDQDAKAFSSSPRENEPDGVWSFYGNRVIKDENGNEVGKRPGSNFYLTTNGVTQPILHMKPGEVQRWRLLNAASGPTLVAGLTEHELHIVANDGITVPHVVTLEKGQPIVLGAGNRVDVMVKAGKPGVYKLQALDPAFMRENEPDGWSIITQSGIDIAPRKARIGEDFPFVGPEPPKAPQQVQYPYDLAIILVSGKPKDMRLPKGPLPAPSGLPSTEEMVAPTPDKTRQVAFENCGRAFFQDPNNPGGGGILPSCEYYFMNKYDTPYWDQRSTPQCIDPDFPNKNPDDVPCPQVFETLLMMRDDNDCTEYDQFGVCLKGFTKEGIFTFGTPLFNDMYVGNLEEWTVINRSFTDHPFHIHQNPFLVTHINGKPLTPPEWRDTILVPGTQPQPDPAQADNPEEMQCPIYPPNTPGKNCTGVTYGSITFRTTYDPVTAGDMVMHCHILQHEDIAMMQQLVIKERVP